MKAIRLGTRGSALALWQARHVAARLAEVAPHLPVQLIEITSTGDQVTDVPLSTVEGTGFFTATLERALIDEQVDVAVHSYKDLPVAETPGLVVAAVPPRGPVEDVLCAQTGVTLGSLPPGARIGTCSARRTAQIRGRRPDLDIRPLRGNVPTRIGRVTSGELDAVVLARAGLERLALEEHISEVFPVDAVMPAPAQGALAVQCRLQDEELRRVLAWLDHGPTRHAVEAERTVLHALGGGCSVPVGATATEDEAGVLRLSAAVFELDAPHVIRVDLQGTEARELGEAAAHRLLDRGAGRILAAFGVWHDYPGNAAVSATAARSASNSPQRGQTPKETA